MCQAQPMELGQHTRKPRQHSQPSLQAAGRQEPLQPTPIQHGVLSLDQQILQGHQAVHQLH